MYMCVWDITNGNVLTLVLLCLQTVYKGRKKKTIEYYAIKSVEKSQKTKVLQEVCWESFDMHFQVLHAFVFLSYDAIQKEAPWSQTYKCRRFVVHPLIYVSTP